MSNTALTKERLIKIAKITYLRNKRRFYRACAKRRTKIIPTAFVSIDEELHTMEMMLESYFCGAYRQIKITKIMAMKIALEYYYSSSEFTPKGQVEVASDDYLILKNTIKLVSKDLKNYARWCSMQFVL